MSDRVFRIQDADGRGPFKPGFTRQWCDAKSRHQELPPWFVEFGHDLIDEKAPGEHLGTAVRDVAQLARWFSPAERGRLAMLGYQVVALDADRVLAESPNQLVFVRRSPLNRGAVVVPWSAIRHPMIAAAFP